MDSVLVKAFMSSSESNRLHARITIKLATGSERLSSRAS